MARSYPHFHNNILLCHTFMTDKRQNALLLIMFIEQPTLLIQCGGSPIHFTGGKMQSVSLVLYKVYTLVITVVMKGSHLFDVA